MVPHEKPRHLGETIVGPLLLQLAFHIRNHAAGNLAFEDFRFNSVEIRKEFCVPRTYFVEIILDL